MAGDAKGMLTGNAFASMDFSFIPFKVTLKNIVGIEVILNWLELEQSNYYLTTIGIESSSTVMNNLSVLFMICLFLFLHF